LGFVKRDKKLKYIADHYIYCCTELENSSLLLTGNLHSEIQAI